MWGKKGGKWFRETLLNVMDTRAGSEIQWNFYKQRSYLKKSETQIEKENVSLLVIKNLNI